MNILDACRDPALFGIWFAKSNKTWASWFAFLAALFGLPLSDSDLSLFRQCTGRDRPRAEGYTEAWLAVGRRGGKSLILATIAVFLAVFRDWSDRLVPGETGLVVVLAVDRRQARVIFRYARALLTRVPLLKPLIARETDELIELTNGISIEITTSNFRVVRGPTILAALCDEIAFWRSDEGSANPDAEVLAALKPAMATVPGAILLCASSPYARRGVLWDAYQTNYAKDSPVLVWQADTKTMNPTVPDRVIADAYEADPARAAAEYGAQFRTDVETFVSREVIDAAVVAGCFELPPASGISYAAFVDPSGGSSDSMTLAVAHRGREGVAVLDCVREIRAPFSPEAGVGEFGAILKAYRVSKVTGDRYAGEWPRETFRRHGISYEPSNRTKSEIYLAALPLLNSNRVELLDHARLTAQIVGLERRTARGGRDSIDHPPHGHDDVANSALGALVLAAEKRPLTISDAFLERTRQPGLSAAQHGGFTNTGVPGAAYFPDRNFR